MIIALSLVGVTLLIVAGLYAAGVDFPGLIRRSTVARAIHDFLYDRWYINSIYYIVIVGGFAALASLLAIVDLGIDLFYHFAIPVLFALGAAGLRALHRGRTDYYMMLYLYFATALLLFLYLAWG
ncbi:hypothetical protein D1872_262490 [compost metagenome]